MHFNTQDNVFTVCRSQAGLHSAVTGEFGPWGGVLQPWDDGVMSCKVNSLENNQAISYNWPQHGGMYIIDVTLKPT